MVMPLGTHSRTRELSGRKRGSGELAPFFTLKLPNYILNPNTPLRLAHPTGGESKPRPLGVAFLLSLNLYFSPNNDKFTR